jgi:hypothetical protein
VFSKRMWREIRWLIFFLSLLPHSFGEEDPQRDGKGYIIIECRDGLANRLRLLAGYLFVMEQLQQQRQGQNAAEFSHIFMVWDLNDACPGHFLQLYEPIENVSFISRHDVKYLAPMANKIYPPSFMNYLEVLNRFSFHRKDDPPHIWHLSRLEMYSRFRPVVDILQIVSRYVASHKICEMAAIHIRRTDLDDYVHHTHQENHTISDAQYEEFIESLPRTMSIFVMTDNPLTQKYFLEKYGSDRVLIYQPLHLPERTFEDHRHLRIQSRGTRRLTTVRYTTLQHTLVDVMIAAHSATFLGNPVSSLSELVHLVNMTFVSKLDDPCYQRRKKK